MIVAFLALAHAAPTIPEIPEIPAEAPPCRAAPWITAERRGSAAPASSCVAFDLDMAGRGFTRWPSVGVTQGVALQRARAEVALRTAEGVQVRAAVVGARSGGAEGYVGIDGEAYVPVVQIAEARWDWRATGLAASAGLVDDIWAMALQPAWQRRDMARPMVTDQGWVPRNDEGAWVGYTAGDGRVSARASVTGGEGANRRERNDQVDVGATVVVRPFADGDEPGVLELAAHARRGSYGIEAARDHRVAAAAIVRRPEVVVGVDGLMGWGLAGDGLLEPAGASAWARVGDDLPAVGWARLDLAWDDRGSAASRETVMLLGGGPRLPLRARADVSGQATGAWVALGWERRVYGVDAAPISVTGVVPRTDAVFLQLGGRLIDAAPFGR